MSGRPDGPSHFARRNALVDRGWLGVLNAVQHGVWTVYDRFADGHGLSRVQPLTIAKMVDHAGTKHVVAARRELVKLGLLTIVDAGGGRHDQYAVVRVHVPPVRGAIPPPTGTAPDPEQADVQLPPTHPQIRPRSDSDPGPIPSPDPPPIPVTTHPQIGSAYKDVRSIVRSSIRNTAAARQGDGDCSGFAGGKARKPPNPNHQPLVDHFHAGWERVQKRSRKFDRAADGRLFRRLLTLADDDLATAKRVVDAYLADSGWPLANGHPLGHLVNFFNKYTGTAPVGSFTNGRRSGPDFSHFIHESTLPDGTEQPGQAAAGVRPDQAGGGADGVT